MNILITGGNGDIAKGVGKYFRETGHTVYSPTKEELNVVSAESIINYIKDKSIDVLINNAGYIKTSTTVKANDEDWLNNLTINLYGSFLCSKYTILKGCKIIINIGSTSGFEGKAEWGAYCASKAGILSLTETLSNEGIEAYSLNIGRTDTKMRSSLFPNEDKTTLMSIDRIIKFLYNILILKLYKSGNHLILTKNSFYILPQRKCPK